MRWLAFAGVLALGILLALAVLVIGAGLGPERGGPVVAIVLILLFGGFYGLVIRRALERWG